MRNLFVDTPRVVLISLAVIVGSLVLFGVLASTLGSARDAAVEQNNSITQQISNAENSLTQSFEDQRFVADNQEVFEGLMAGDRLVPHTRRAAISELQRLAAERGLSNLSYSFQAAGDAASPEVAGNQPTSGAYKVSIERLELRLGAPFDGPVYAFVEDLTNSFPGSAVVQSISLTRLPQVTDDALRDVSEGRDSRLVEGTIQVSWRTAQAAVSEASEGTGQ